MVKQDCVSVRACVCVFVCVCVIGGEGLVEFHMVTLGVLCAQGAKHKNVCMCMRVCEMECL